MIKDLTNFVRPFVYGEPPFPVCADSLVCTNYLHELTAEALGYKVTLI